MEDPDKQPELKGALELALGRSRSQDEFLHLRAMGKEGEELDPKDGDGVDDGKAKGNYGYIINRGYVVKDDRDDGEEIQ